MIYKLLIAAFIVSYIIWLFYNRVMGKNLGLAKVITWVLASACLIYLTISVLEKVWGLSFT